MPFLLLSTYSSHQEPIVSIINADVNQGITLQEKTINVINGQVSREDMQASEKLGIKSGCQRKPGKMLKMSTEGGQQN